ncbi:MAG: hypothetical protein NZ898_09795 [Myxococcota bacterium]|nr:hypothetical protein [Myxococcota bacterium]MDW8363543.1 hypothetical protein [Myxococcales bacterium]
MIAKAHALTDPSRLRPAGAPRIALVLVPAVALFGCGGHDDHDHEDPAAHACEHRADPGMSVTAAMTRGPDAPLVEIGEATYTVMLDGSGPRYVRLETSAPRDVLLFVSVADVVRRLYRGDEARSLISGGPNQHCASQIAEHFDVELDAAGTWYLELGPAAVPSVWLMVTDAAGHAH